MNHSIACLHDEEVGRLLSGEVDAARTSELEQHLANCIDCRQRLEQHVGDDGWWNETESSLRGQHVAASLRDAEGIHVEGTCADAASLGETRLRGTRLRESVLNLLGPTDDPNMLGRIGPYEIIGLLGQGGMGAVFKGFDRSLNRFVAIKILLPHLAASGAARKRFSREGQAVAAVVDDHVMAIHCVDEWQGVPYLVMTYSRGVSLQKRLNDNGPLDVREILRIGMQAAKGLAAAHAQGIVHRDIKPANIFLDQNVERVQLMDFGLARAVDDASLTRSGTLAGTPQYMSPEQARAEAVDHRSDLFSLGSVMYAMCTGHAPFRAESSYSVLRLITDKEPRPIREINPDVPEWLVAITTRLMSKKSDDRFESAVHVAELLESCLAHVQRPTTNPLPIVVAPKSQFRSSSISKRGVLMLTVFIGCVSFLLMLLQQTENEIGTVLGKTVYESDFNEKNDLEQNLTNLFLRPVELKFMDEQGIDVDDDLKNMIADQSVRESALQVLRRATFFEFVFKKYSSPEQPDNLGSSSDDAYLKWLEEREKAGDFKLTVSQHRDLLFKPLSKDERRKKIGIPIVRSTKTSKFLEPLVAIPNASTSPVKTDVAPNDNHSTLSGAEQELVTLLDAYDEALKDYSEKGQPTVPHDTYILKLLNFEEKHRGEKVGLFALERIFREAGRKIPTGVVNIGRREGALRLAPYFSFDLFPLVFARAAGPSYEVEIDDRLREYANSTELSSEFRARVRFSRAESILNAAKSWAQMVDRIDLLKSGAKSIASNELDIYEASIKKMGSRQDLDQRITAAVGDLRELASDPDSPQRQSIKAIKESRHFFEMVNSPKNPSVAESAAALLFEWEHLRVGADAPELDLTLVNDRPWSLREQGGKVVVIQFSFTGCGPCELMYPELRKLQEDFPDQVEILTLMRDETLDVCQKKVESGILTWSIAWDRDAEVTKKWAIRSFPTVYLIDKKGKVAANSFDRSELSNRVQKLIGD